MQADIIIEAASVDDLPWAAQLMASSEPWTTLGRTLEQCRATFANPEHQIFIARRDGSPLGFAILRRRGVINSPYIPSIGVAPDARGQGVGSVLLRFAEMQVAPDARDLFICVSSFNPRARRLYERHGYRLVGELDDYIIDGASELLLRKRLAARG